MVNAAKIRQFWDWFKARADKVRSDPRRHVPEIGEMVHRLHDDLAWEMGQAGDGAFEFILRTEASELRYLTQELVSGAPSMAGWRILNWRPADRHTGGGIIEMEGAKPLHADTCTFGLEADPRFPVVHVTVFSPYFAGKPTDRQKYAGYLMLDGVLGEKLVEDAIDGVEFRGGPKGRVSADGLRDRLLAVLNEARSRPSSGNEDWLSMEGSRDDLPLFVMMASGLDPSRMAGHPWRLDVDLAVRNPNEHGLPSSDELKELQALEDRIGQFVQSKASLLEWCHRTHNGVRTSSFYLDRPEGLGDSLDKWLKESGAEASVLIDYDPRWRDYRAFLPKG